MITAQMPVIEFNELRKYIQEIAKKQWSNLRPEQMAMRGMVNLPSTQTAKQIIDWFVDKRELFELHELPDTFIIKHQMAYILVSEGNPTYAES
jgi:ABC-type multidrug transport system permease subunit